MPLFHFNSRTGDVVLPEPFQLETLAALINEVCPRAS
jgi:hypothetical protein